MHSSAIGREVRRHILEQSRRANLGHIGSALSIADIVGLLACDVLRFDGGRDRDRFVLGKGHAVLAWYCALHVAGRLDGARLETFAADGTLLAGHPEHAFDDVDFSTGSLGQGLSMGVGAALAARMASSDRRTYVLMSDAECNEGSVWEAAMFAAQQRLAGLTAIIDFNGQQALGYTRDVLDQSAIRSRWEAFGWAATEVDGHDSDALRQAITTQDRERPTVVIAHTTFGSGVSFMESRIEWHYLPMDDDQFNDALQQVEAA